MLTLQQICPQKCFHRSSQMMASVLEVRIMGLNLTLYVDGVRMSSIDSLLNNKKYRDVSTATTALTSYDTRNKQCTKYLFSNHHEPIIDDKAFIAVTEEKQRRSNVEYDENGTHRKKTRYTAKLKMSGSDETK